MDEKAETDLLGPGDDIFGLLRSGLPERIDAAGTGGYDFVPLLRRLEPPAKWYLGNHKYENNYDFNKSILPYQRGGRTTITAIRS